jgi:disulfide bond formation protein DsbB
MITRPSLSLYAALAASAALAVAFFSQYVLGAYPCELCLLQRYPYGVVAMVGLLAWGIKKYHHALLALCIIGFLSTGGIAAYHVAVEQKWVAAPDSCTSAPLGADVSLEELKAKILSAPKVSCADIGASFAGLSMATWNMLYAFGCAGILLLLWRKEWKNI